MKVAETAPSNGPDALPTFHQFDLDFEGTTIHCFEGGTSGRPMILLHGSGAGCATLSNFRRVMGPLALDHRVLAADLIGFGQSGLKSRTPYFDVAMWVRQLRFLLDRAGEGVICVGHSLSGPISLKAAAEDERIAAVVTTGTGGWIPRSSDGQAYTRPRWRFPESREQVRTAVENTFYDRTLADDEEIDRRLQVLQRPGYKAYWEEMFAGPSSRYVDESTVTPTVLERVTCPVSLLHGADDKSLTPEDTSIPISRHLRFADVHILAACAHSVAHERPSDFLSVVRTLDYRLNAAHQS